MFNQLLDDGAVMSREQRLEVMRDGAEAGRVLRGGAPAPRCAQGSLARRRLGVVAQLQIERKV